MIQLRWNPRCATVEVVVGEGEGSAKGGGMRRAGVLRFVPCGESTSSSCWNGRKFRVSAEQAGEGQAVRSEEALITEHSSDVSGRRGNVGVGVSQKKGPRNI